MAQEPKEVTPSLILTNFSLAHRNLDVIWRAVMPIIQVPKRQGFYWEQNKADNFTLIDDSLSPNAAVNENGTVFSKKPYAVESKGTGDWISQEELDEEDGINILTTQTEVNNDLLELRQDKRVADLVFASANYPTANKVVLSGVNQWSDTTSNPIKEISTGMLAMLARGNLLVFGAETWEAFRRHPQILDAVKASTRNQGAAGGLASDSEIGALFTTNPQDPVRVVVGQSKYTTDSGATFTRVWGKHCAIIRTTANPTRRSQIFGATISQNLRSTGTFFDGTRGESGSTLVKTTWNRTEIIMAADVGYFIENAVA